MKRQATRNVYQSWRPMMIHIQLIMIQ